MVRAWSTALAGVANTTCRYAFDVVGELFFSCMFGFLDGAYDYGGYIGALNLLNPFFVLTCACPLYLRPLMLISGAVIPRVSQALRAMKRIEDAAQECVKRRQLLLNSYSPHHFTDMLQSFFDIARDKGNDKDFGMEEVKMEIWVAL
jgi:hypothetical protein